MCLQFVRTTVELNYHLIIPNTSKFGSDVGQTIINDKNTLTYLGVNKTIVFVDRESGDIRLLG